MNFIALKKPIHMYPLGVDRVVVLQAHSASKPTSKRGQLQIITNKAKVNQDRYHLNGTQA